MNLIVKCYLKNEYYIILYYIILYYITLFYNNSKKLFIFLHIISNKYYAG